MVLRSVQVVHGTDPLHLAILLIWRKEPLANEDSFLSVSSSPGVPHLNESARTGKLIIGKLWECIGIDPINSDKFIGSDKIIG